MTHVLLPLPTAHDSHVFERGYIRVLSVEFLSVAVAMADQQEVRATDEMAPENPEQQEAPAEENEVADKTSEQPAKEMQAVVLTGIGGLQYFKTLKKTKPTVGKLPPG
jgi:hypothetical protein